VKFGVHLPTVRLNDPDPLAMLTEFVSESDAMGYEYLAVNDHFFNVLDPVTSLAAVAGATKHMRFIPAGLLPIHRGLVPTAKMFVTLDLFTGGRMIAGLAAGSSNVEYTINNLDPAERWHRFDEIAVALRSLLQPGAPAFKGKYYNTEGLDLGVMPGAREAFPSGSLPGVVTPAFAASPALAMAGSPPPCSLPPNRCERRRRDSTSTWSPRARIPQRFRTASAPGSSTSARIRAASTP
jgi:alkanesulfonate monooxygenase SsuD/methylene tetrahydromethanopterin reductase-like flavin-dependent oxidoreductase (luciferase family)